MCYTLASSNALNNRFELKFGANLAGLIVAAMLSACGGGDSDVGSTSNNLFTTRHAVFSWAPVGQQFAFTTVPAINSSTLELVAVGADGTGRSLISSNLRQGGLLYSAFAWSPSATHIAYLLEDSGNGIELEISYPDGSNTIRIGDHLVSDGSGMKGPFSTVEWSPDGSGLAFLAELTPGTPELFVVNVDGTNTTTVSGSLVAGGFAQKGIWSPDGTRLAYLAAQDTAGLVELFLVNADGTGNVKVSTVMENGDSLANPVWSPDGNRIAYLRTESDSTVPQLHIAVADGSGNIIAFPVPLMQGIDISSMRWTPNSTHLAYIADLESPNLMEAFVVSANGFDQTKVSGNLVSGGFVSDLSWAPDGPRLLYRADPDVVGEFELYSVLPDGSDLQQISDSLAPGGSVLRGDLIAAWSPDASAITYAADQDVLGEIEAFVSSPAGQLNTRISNLNAAGGGALQPIWAPDGATLAYTAAQDGEFLATTVVPDGSIETRISGSETSDGLLRDLAWSADAKRLAYRVRSGNSVNFYTVRADGKDRVQIAAGGVN